MDGNNEAEVVKLRHKTEEFADCVRTGFLTREDATVAVHSTIMKTLEYPMAATTISKKQWEYIMAPILMSTLPRMGFVRTLPRALVYGPEDYVGLGIMHPWYNQNITQMQVILRETATQSITGDLIRASLEQMRLEVGLPGSSSDWNLREVGVLITDCWLKDLLRFMSDHQLALVDELPQLDLYRENDRFLMETFCAFGYRGKELIMLNECRKWHRVSTLAEIVTADGTSIEGWAWNGDMRGSSNRLNQYEWERRPPVDNGHWRVWQRALGSCLVNTGSKHKLRYRMGKWKKLAKQRWKWFYSANEQRIFHFQGLGWKVHMKMPGRTQRLQSQKFYASTILTDTLPSDSQMATVRWGPTCIFITGIGEVETGVIDNEESEPPPSLLEHILEDAPKLDKWAVDFLHCTDNGREVGAAIVRGDARGISDGSFKDERGTSAFSLLGKDTTKSAVGVNSVPGIPADQSAYRSELAGVSGMLAVIRAICTQHDIQQGAITLGLDGEQALKTAAGDWQLKPDQPDVDLIRDIRHKIQRLPIAIRWHWIRGHQDDGLAYEELDEWAKSNVKMDTLAKRYWKHLQRQGIRPVPLRFQDEGWSINYQGKKLSKVHKKELYRSLFQPTIFSYWAKKSDIPLHEIAVLDWEACGHTFRNLTIAKKRRVVKHASGHMPCGKMMKLWRFQNHHECPRCQSLEDPRHILMCPVPSANLAWDTALTKLEVWLESALTFPDLTRAIIQTLRNWRDHTTDVNTPTSLYGLDRAVAHQEALGWYNFQMGRVSLRWRGVQQKYYEWLGKRNTGKKWVQALILKLFEVSWTMWDQRNDVLHNTVTPAAQRFLDSLHEQVEAEYELGGLGMMPKDALRFRTPKRKVLAYDKEMTEQWLASIELARYRYTNRQQLAYAAVRQQRTIMTDWLRAEE